MATPLTFNWSNFSGNISGGVSQNTGGINVGITYANDGNGNNSSVVTTTQFVDTAAGETFATNSSLQLGGSGGVGSTSTTTVDFSAVSGSGFSGEVDNVTFRINDFDTSSWIDVVTVRAFDADGNLLNVELDWNGSSFSGTNTTLSSNVANGSASTETGSILVSIAGPVASIEIDYDNNGSGGQALWVTDIHFDAVDLPDGTVSGTSGNDTITAGYVDTGDRDTVDDGDAILSGHVNNDDLIEAGSGNDSVDGSLGDDTIFGGNGNDTLEGNVGDDTIFGGFGRDTIFGGDGDDVLHEGSTGSAAGTLFGGAGDDTLFTGTGSANDTLFGGSDNDTLIDQGTEASNDTLDGGTGNDTVTAGLGSDTILINAADGSDTITGGEDVDGLDNDTIDFTDGTGLQGVDVTLSGSEEGSYTFPTDGGDGTFVEIETFDLTDQNDTFDGSLDTSGTTVAAGAGNDEVSGGSGIDSIDGGTGDDSLFGDRGNDSISGGDGDDVIDGGFGTDVLDGGDGNDTVSYLQSFGNPANETLELDLDAGTAILNGSATETATNFENAISGNTMDTITGTSGANMIDSGGNNDTIDGAAGDDTLFAGAGDDDVTGGEGNDTIFAGSGDDSITFSEGDAVNAGSGDDLIVLEDLGELGNGTIEIDGGTGDETGGDTLRIGSLGTLTQEVRDTFVDDGTGSFSGSITLDDGTILNFSEIENIICFTPGTRIATPHGLILIEDLEIGDLVVTRDHGLQPIRWLEGRIVPAVDRFAPVRIRKNVLAGQDRDLIVSPQHRVLFQGYRAELLFGESEVLVSAKHLIDGMDVTQDEQPTITYIHIMFDRHEIIYAEGAATESFHPGDIGMNAVTNEAREELFGVFPELRADQTNYGKTARRCLRANEAKLIRT